MRQYREIKQDYQDAILFFRLGDFYEMFHEDAQKAAKILDIALTSRDKNSPNPVPLCGVPHHSASGYIEKLLNDGQKVAICEQIEDPKAAKGIVRRKVVRVVTPGLQTEEEGLKSNETNPIVSVFATDRKYGLAWIEAASGEFHVASFDDFRNFEDEVWRLSPREVVVPKSDQLDSWVAAYSAVRKKALFERRGRLGL